MSFGITKTIPARVSQEEFDKLYDGTVKEAEFHMAGNPSRLEPGHYVYTIYDNHLVGRLKITRIEPNASVNPKSGRPRTLIYVEAPGERLPHPIPKRGHQGTRYYDGEDWPET